jgi:hypothetical protein
LEKTRLVQNKKQPNQAIFKLIAKLLFNPVTTFFLDPVIPKLVSVYLHQYLNRWKQKGLIKTYEVEVQRLGRLTYKIGLHMLAGKKETKTAIINYITSNIEKMLK